MSSLPSGTVTFLFTDVEGSTRLWDANPSAMQAALARHDALAEEIVARHDGHLILERGEGDSLFAVFSRAHDAVAAAYELQKAFTAEPWPEGAPLKVRMAVHTGECETRAGTYYGSPVNRCARLRAIGHGGQVLVSQATAQLVQDSLPTDSLLRDCGNHRLRDLLRPERVFELARTVASGYPPLRSLDSRPNNLPVQWMSFVGREREVQELKSLLAKHRLVTITGSGGCGKTRLSLQLGAELLDDYEDGCWLLEFAAISAEDLDSNADLLWDTSARALRIPRQGVADEEVLVTRALAERRMLVIVDNCEHVRIAAARFVFKLLRECPGVTVLCTSRELLDVPGEAGYRVPPLGLPPEPAGKRFKELSAFDSVQLFRDRASARDSSFALGSDNIAAVAQICRRLDGIPLAIEQAASNVIALAPEQILARLQERLRAAGPSTVDVPSRHVTMAATIDWSYDMLSGQERLLFERQSVFVGGWSLELAEAVCVDDRLHPPELLDSLQALIRKSLVHADDTGDREKRYRYLEIVRSYALEKCRELSVLQCRHAKVLGDLASTADAELIGPDHAKWGRILDAEYDNLRAALNWSLPNEPATAFTIGHHLRRYWQTRGHLGEGKHWLERIVDLGIGDPTKRAQALNALGAIRWRQGDLVGAQGAFVDSLKLFRMTESLVDQGAAINNLAIVASLQGDLPEACRLLSESLEIARRIGDAVGVGHALLNLGMLELDRGDYSAASRILLESLAIFTEARDDAQIPAVHLNLAEALHHEALTAKAIVHLERCIKALADSPDDATLSEALLLLALVCADLQMASEAAILLGAATLCSQEAGATFTERQLRHASKAESISKGVLGDHYQDVRNSGAFMTRALRMSTAIEICNSLTSTIASS